MPTAERRALLLLLTLALVGQGVRHLATLPGESPGQVQLLATLSPGSPLAQRDSAMRQGRALAPGEEIDVEVAPAAELARLPRVGPRLAKLIVADREAHGAFGSLAGLDRVPGIGPGLLRVIGPHVKFTGGCQGGECSAGRIIAASANDPGPALDLNSATLQQLVALPGVGPVKAAAILQYREKQGRFAAVDDLARVPGFGPGAVKRLRERLSAH